VYNAYLFQTPVSTASIYIYVTAQLLTIHPFINHSTGL